MEDTKVVLNIESQKPYVLKRCGILLAVSLVMLVVSCMPASRLRGTYLYLEYLSMVFLIGSFGYTMLMMSGFMRQVRSLEYLPGGIKVNDDVYTSDLSHGVGIDNKKAVSGRIDMGGMNMIVYAMDDNGRRIKKTYWTGPYNNRYCAEKRKELRDLIQVQAGNRRERELLRIKDEGQSMKVRFDRSEEKRKRYISSGIGAAAALAGIVTGFFLIGGDEVMAGIAFFSWLIAAAVAYYSIKNFVSLRINLKNAAQEVIYTKDSLTVNGKRYEITDSLTVDVLRIGDPTIRNQVMNSQRPKKMSDEGYYFRISDGSKEDLYWMGTKIDGPASMIFSVCIFIKLIRERA